MLLPLSGYEQVRRPLDTLSGGEWTRLQLLVLMLPLLVALSPASGAVLSTITLPGAPGGGGQYSGAPSDIGIGNNVLVVPTGSTVTAFG